jgi:hypothetical protein
LAVPSTALDKSSAPERFRITHPFHPYAGDEFELVVWRHNWSEERVYFEDVSGRLRSVPVGWTDLRADDPVVVVGGGRSHFRVEDLLELTRRLRESCSESND